MGLEGPGSSPKATPLPHLPLHPPGPNLGSSFTSPKPQLCRMSCSASIESWMSGSVSGGPRSAVRVAGLRVPGTPIPGMQVQRGTQQDTQLDEGPETP